MGWVERSRDEEMRMKSLAGARVVLVAVIAVGCAGGAALAQSAGQDVKNAGSDTKAAATDTGHATKDAAVDTKNGTAKVYHKTASGTKTAAQDTANGTKKLGDKITGKPTTPATPQ
jgi:hypothetical protein